MSSVPTAMIGASGRRNWASAAQGLLCFLVSAHSLPQMAVTQFVLKATSELSGPGSAPR